MDTKSVSIYIANGSRTYLRLVAHSLNNCDDRVKSLKVDDHEYVSQMFFDGNVFVNTGLEPKTPLMAAPVRMNGETVAIITLDDIPFEKFSLYYQNLFKITIDLVSSALSRAFSYIEATESLRFVDGTQILTRDVFEAIRKNKLTAKEKLNINYTIVTPEGPIESIKDYAVKIKRLLRETDYIGLGTQDELLILLSNTESSDVARILERFAKKGLHLKPLNEELSYA